MKIVACGGRGDTYNAFKTQHAASKGEFVGLLVDSEERVVDVNRPWAHLASQPKDKWDKPKTATDDQVFLMTTCMETWIVADRETLRKHYGSRLNEKALPAAHNLETKDRHVVQDDLVKATKDCTNAYSKGKRSFEVLEKLDPKALTALPSFQRMVRILNEKLSPYTEIR